MDHVITLKTGDTFSTTRLDLITLPEGDRAVRCIVGTRIVRRRLDEIESIEAQQEDGSMRAVDLDSLAPSQALARREVSTAGLPPARRLMRNEEAADTPPAKAEGGELPTTKAELEAEWVRRHGDVPMPTNEKGKVTVESLRRALSPAE